MEFDTYASSAGLIPTEARGNYLPEAPYLPEHVSGAERQNFPLIAQLHLR